jgi:hypothetical protein
MDYLLDYLSKEMQGEKRALALQLFGDPLACDPILMRRWIARDLCEFFSIVQSQCQKDLQRARGRLISFKMGGIAIRMNAVVADGGEFALDWLARVYANQICARVREDLSRNGATLDALSAGARNGLLLLYALAEVFSWVLLGVVRYREGRFVLAEDAGVAKALQLYLFGHQMASDSHLADALSHAMVLKTAADSGASLAFLFRENHPLIELLVHNAMDKFFCCHPHYDKALQRVGTTMASQLRQRCRLICYLYLRASEPVRWEMEREDYDPWTTSVTTGITNDELREAGFSEGEVSALLEMSSCHSPDERLLEKLSGGAYSVGAMNLKYALVAYSADFFDSNAAYGDWFQDDYVRTYLKTRVRSNRYAVLNGFKSSNADPLKYDVDAMIFDRRFERLYFLQIKHRSRTVLPFLRDELKEFSMGKSFTTAVRQLKAVQDSFASARLVDKVKSSMSAEGFNARRIDAAYLQRHSGCLIIHSVENFDFAVKDGIAMYEWNTFRNLLSGAVLRSVDNVVHPVSMDLGGAPLDDPFKVAEAYMCWEEAQSRPAGQFSCRQRLDFKQRVYCELLSTRYIEVLGRWRLYRPFLRLEFPAI